VSSFLTAHEHITGYFSALQRAENITQHHCYHHVM